MFLYRRRCFYKSTVLCEMNKCLSRKIIDLVYGLANIPDSIMYKKWTMTLLV